MRSTGFEGFPALGVCFGPVVTAVSPLVAAVRGDDEVLAPGAWIGLVLLAAIWLSTALVLAFLPAWWSLRLAGRHG